MKREYVKPVYLAEEFGFAQTIADVCIGDKGENVPLHESKNTCAWLVDGETAIFFSSVAACKFPLDPNGSYDEFCYNAPEGTVNMFAS